MSTASSAFEFVRFASLAAARRSKRVLVGLEVSIVYAGILYYIWRWQFTHPSIWMLLLAVIFLSHSVHGDNMRTLGLSPSDIRASAQIVLPLALAAYIPAVVHGLARHTLVLIVPGKQALVSFAAYGTWSLVQQYLMQSYFHNRLMTVMRNPHQSSFLVAVMFGATHIPNPVLMLVTTLGGFLLAEVFARPRWIGARHRNIWPLGLAQAVGGFLVAAITPASLIHNMRVGPGYFFYGLRY